MTDPPYTSQPRSDYPQVIYERLSGSTVEGTGVETPTKTPTPAPGPKNEGKKDKKPNPGKSKGHFK